MPITSNNTAVMSERQAFNGKGLTFVEMIFDTAITGSATTPSTKDSTFQKCREAVQEHGVLLAQSFRLAGKATDNDAAEALQITADESIDSYQFILEGTPGQFNNSDSAGDINMDPHSGNATDPGVIADAEADIETSVLARISVGDSAGNVHVKVRYLPADGVRAAGGNAVYGMFDQRGDA